MRKRTGFIVAGVVVVGLALAGWFCRGHLQGLAWAAGLPVPAPAQQQPDVLYTWVDKDGVTHFEQDTGLGTRVTYDGSRITPLETPPARPPSLEKASAAADAAQDQAGEGLHKLRNELAAGAQRVRDAKAAASPDL